VPAVAVVRLGIARSLSSGEDCTRRLMRQPSQLHRVIAFLFRCLLHIIVVIKTANASFLQFYRQFHQYNRSRAELCRRRYFCPVIELALLL